MKQEMLEGLKNTESNVQPQEGIAQMRFYSLIDHINVVLGERIHSPSELYDELIYRRVLKPGFFKDFKRVLRTGMREGIIKKEKLFSKVSTSRKFPNFFTKEQMVKYFWACDDERVAMMSLIGLFCGLRTGEVTRIKIADIDFNVCLIKLVQTKGRKDRMAPLIPSLHGLVKKWIRYVGNTEYLFPSYEQHTMARIGEFHISQKTLTDGFNKVIVKAGLDATDARYGDRRSKHTFYAFRHSFATLSIERRTPPEIVQRAMGHVKIDTTLSTYTHIRNPVMVESIAKAFSPQVPAPQQNAPVARPEGALDALAKKFALGEIDEVEFLRKKQVLVSHGLT